MSWTFEMRGVARGGIALLLSLAAVASIDVTIAGAQEPTDQFIAGTKPDRRPDRAPRIQTLDHDADWRAAALRGVSKPIPSSLRFVDDQGAWFTPFTRRNMPPPYDIRALYPPTSRRASRAR
ncbi:MAG: hypothetical protein JNM89_07630 [Hyphomicrobiaceae bacterium]|nr:hypothetical protein [Hyphomicrobiaceae bacterium]